MNKPKERGLLYLLERSEELLDRAAEEIYAAHTLRGRWPKEDNCFARQDYKELRALVKGLRKAHKYHTKHFLGGQATMFDAIADRIRAGEKMKAVMADYGLKLKE